MDWVLLNIVEALGWADVVSEAADWCLMPSHIIILPLSKEANENISSEFSCKDLGEEINIGHKGSLKNNWDV